LCAGDDAQLVLEWAYDEHESILQQGRRNPQAVAKIVSDRFPALRRCIGSPSVRARLNLALRWAVKNQLQVLTPQIFVEGIRLCDEDTDLGLDYALPRLIARTDPTSSAPLLPSRQDQPPPQRTISAERQPAKPPLKAAVRTPPSENAPEQNVPTGETERPGGGEVIVDVAERAESVGDQTKTNEHEATERAAEKDESPKPDESENGPPKPVAPPPDQPTNEPAGSSRPEQPEAL
jgi:hypothetical protein